ncbi:efflux RND transporter permease subunit [Fictibacillus sp. 26RED30]|uniref:efflux RND transporter permease subunit n=1 Tax=Fictibacillus sp. 26RED30 TaxID=2745877 RepID=UPI0018CDDFD5|nr:efflux RND transporter permease subunit [Fictibacillus sp. 26RED30]MBH0159263.1 efflux RND transporter permease subunit [Fictibacillus sp. 26RED30]
MQKFIKFSINNKLAIWIVTLFIIVFGTFSGYSMKLETLPNINEPIVDVTTIYPGASPNEVTENVTKPIETKVEGLEGVKSVTSTSFENASSVQIQYDLKKDMEEAEREVKEIVSTIELPAATEQPKVARLSFNDLPILVLSLADDKRSIEELSKIAEDDIKRDFESIEGVSEAKVIGNKQKEIQLSFSPEKLSQFKLQEENVVEYVKALSKDTPLGLQVVEQKEQAFVVNGAVASIDDLKSLEVPTIENAEGFATLGQLAEVKEVTKEQSVARINGKEAIGIQIYKSAAGNTVKVVDGIKEKMASNTDKFDSIEFTSVLNEGDPIKDSVHVMFEKALMGAAFAILIILLFLRNIKTTLIAVVSIPLSLIISIIFLNQLDITLNLMTLGAMTVAIGRVVDDSIVVIENIFRRMALKSEVLEGKQLIKAATYEMFSPIVSSTIVTIAVFFPLGLIDGPVGELFLPFGLTIVFALLASLVVSVTIVPMMAHLLLQKKNIKAHEPETKPSFYHKTLNWSLNHKIISFIAINVLLVGSLFLLPLIGVSFMPDSQNKMIIASYNPVPGSTNEEIKKEVQKAEAILLDREHIKHVQSSFGEGNPLNPSDVKQVLFIMNYKDGLADVTKEQDRLAPLLKKANMGEWSIQSSGGNNSLSLYVYGDDVESVNQAIDKVSNTLDDQKDLKGLDSTSSDTLSQLGFSMDLEKMAKFGVQPLQIYQTLGAKDSLDTLTSVDVEGNEVPVRLVQEADDLTKNTILDKKITTLANEEVALSEFLSVKEENAPASITKRNGRVYGVVSATITNKDVKATTEAVKNEVDKINFENGITVEYGGVSAQIDDSFTQLGIAMGSAIMIVYFVLVVTFGGGLAPLAILFSLPYAIIGSLLGLFVIKEPISISVMIGALMLIGIVVTNAIVLVDRIIQKEKEGTPLRQAILEAGMTRLRPILMTALATIGALAPLVISGQSDGSGLISRGLGVTVIGGLISSTLLTLIVVPIVYETLIRVKRKIFKKKIKESNEKAA